MSGSPAGLVMFCFDGSEGSLSALRQAASNLRPGPRLVVTAWQTVSTQLRATAGFSGALGGESSATDEEERRAAEQAAADGAGAAAEAGMDSDHLAIEARGSIWEALVGVAVERRATLLVCGANGRSSLRDLVYGRTSTGLLHHAPCPVLVARVQPHDG